MDRWIPPLPPPLLLLDDGKRPRSLPCGYTSCDHRSGCTITTTYKKDGVLRREVSKSSSVGSGAALASPEGKRCPKDVRSDGDKERVVEETLTFTTCCRLAHPPTLGAATLKSESRAPRRSNVERYVDFATAIPFQGGKRRGVPYRVLCITREIILCTYTAPYLPLKKYEVYTNLRFSGLLVIATYTTVDRGTVRQYVGPSVCC